MAFRSDRPAYALAWLIGRIDPWRVQTVLGLSRAMEMRDSATAAHGSRVAEVCTTIAERMGLSEERIEWLHAASSLHDVGKLAISDRILLKPGSLTAGERRSVQLHAEIGYRLLIGVEEGFAEVAISHHEWFDGSGYPRGTNGDEIPVDGRIVAVADVFDALLSTRPYRPAFSLDETIGIMESERAVHFDPEVLDALLIDAEALAPAGDRMAIPV